MTKESLNADGSNPIITYGYDDNGSLTSKTPASGDATVYAYNLQERLSSVTIGSNPTISYKYNPDGIRVQKSITGGAITNYLIDSFNHTGYAQVFKETTGSAYVMYITGLDVIGVAPGSRFYFLYDGHGSVRQFVSSTVWQWYQYDAYGNIVNSVTPVISLLYTGEWRDPNLDWHYNRDRWLIPSLGIFNQPEYVELSQPARLWHGRAMLPVIQPVLRTLCIQGQSLSFWKSGQAGFI